jgi:hypothetical protein
MFRGETLFRGESRLSILLSVSVPPRNRSVKTSTSKGKFWTGAAKEQEKTAMVLTVRYPSTLDTQ